MRARSLLFTVYGDSIRPRGGEVGLGSLIRIMGPLGLTPRAVRAATARMARQGWLQTRHVGRRAFYSLTARGAWRVEQGVRRVYRLDPDPWDGRWRLLTYTIPEGRRPVRDRLRRELLWLGLGPLSRSTWLTPHDIADLLRELVAGHGVQERVALFEATHVGPTEARALTARCWDLTAIASRYRGFTVATRRRGALLRRRLRNGTFSDAECFAERTRLVHEYRKFLFVDPGLPDALLPPAWPGKDAARAFRDVYRLLAGPSTRFLEAAFEHPPGRPCMQNGDPFSLATASRAPRVDGPSGGAAAPTSL